MIAPPPAQEQIEPPKPHAAPATQPAETAAPLPETVVIRAGNLRSGPSKAAGAVATLAKGTKVTVVERRGNWVHVQAAAQDGGQKALEGWMFNTFLSDAAGAATTEQAPEKHARAGRTREESEPADQAPAERVPAAEVPADQAAAEHAPAVQAPAEQAPAEHAPAAQAPADQAPPKSP
jgi:SH3-like domain-containing protein